MVYSVTVTRMGSDAQPVEERFEATEVIIADDGDLVVRGHRRMSAYEAEAWDSVTVIRARK